METTRIATDDMVFDARVDGPDDGDVVILLHGFPETSWSWRHQLPVLAGAGYRVVAPDQRGYSPGARPADLAAYETRHLVSDVVAIADAVGAERFHLVGHDWGAAVGWQVAGRHADRVRTFTSLCVPHPKAFARALAGEAGSRQPRRSAYFERFCAEGTAEEFAANGGEVLVRDIYELGGLPGDIEPYLEVFLQPGAMQATLNWYRVASLTDVDGLGPITMPTLYVWSTDDAAIAKEGAHWTGEYVAGPYRFEVFESVNHWIPESAPERLNGVLLAHLRG